MFKAPEIPGDAAGVRTALLEAGDHLRGLNAARPDTADAAAVENWRADVRSATDFIHLADPILSTLERAPQARGGAGTGTTFSSESEIRSMGEAFVRSQQYADRRDARTEAVEVRTLLQTEKSDPGAGIFMPVGQPMAPLQRRLRMFVRDLCSVVPTGLNSVPYIREVSAATNEVSATAVAEGAAKPEVTMQFTQIDAPIRKIAAWIPITTEIADDASTLRGYIDQRLGYMLALREEAQILNGNGTAPNLRGILQTSGILTRAAGADKITTLGLAIGQIEAVDGEADGIAMNPTDFWAMVTTRSANQFDGGFSTGLPYGGPPTNVWGVPVVRTRQITAGKAIVGAWRLGATIFDREQVTIRTTDSHSDYFIYNKLVVLAEERLGLAVNRPDLFVDVTLP